MVSALTALHRARRRLFIHRRALAALCLAVLTWSVVTAVRPPDQATVTVWTAVRDLPSGTVLGRAELQETRVPSRAVPQAPHDWQSLNGRTLAAPVGAGEIATTTRVMGNAHLAGYPGRSAVPLRIPDADTVNLLHAGDRVDLVASDPQSPGRGSLIATDAIVLAIPQPTSAGTAPTVEGRLVVFALPTAEVVGVNAAASSLFLNVIWNR